MNKRNIAIFLLVAHLFLIAAVHASAKEEKAAQDLEVIFSAHHLTTWEDFDSFNKKIEHDPRAENEELYQEINKIFEEIRNFNQNDFKPESRDIKNPAYVQFNFLKSRCKVYLEIHGGNIPFDGNSESTQANVDQKIGEPDLIPDDPFVETNKLISVLKNCETGVNVNGVYNTSLGVNLWRLMIEVRLFKDALNEKMKTKYMIKRNFLTIKIIVDSEHTLFYTFVFSPKEHLAMLSSVKVNNEIVDTTQGSLVLAASRRQLYEQDKATKEEVDEAKNEVRKYLTSLKWNY